MLSDWCHWGLGSLVWHLKCRRPLDRFAMLTVQVQTKAAHQTLWRFVGDGDGLNYNIDVCRSRSIAEIFLWAPSRGQTPHPIKPHIAIGDPLQPQMAPLVAGWRVPCAGQFRKISSHLHLDCQRFTSSSPLLIIISNLCKDR
jgi:hypothetical protein